MWNHQSINVCTQYSMLPVICDCIVVMMLSCVLVEYKVHGASFFDNRMELCLEQCRTTIHCCNCKLTVTKAAKIIICD